jgi:hypothetical protein
MRFHPSFYRSVSLALGLLFALQTVNVPFEAMEDGLKEHKRFELFWKLFSKADLAESTEEKKGETLEHDDKKEEIKYGYSLSVLQSFYGRQRLAFASFQINIQSPCIKIQAPPPKFG